VLSIGTSVIREIDVKPGAEEKRLLTDLVL
jgi:hypothetical protein